MDIHKLINKLAEEEESFLKLSFLAPAVKGGSVGVRIQGIVCRFVLENSEFSGWGIFEPVSLERVRLLRPAGRALIRRYLDRLTPLELIIADGAGAARSAILAHPAGSPVKIKAPVVVHLVERAEQFRHVVARFDGFNFWFDRLHPGRNPATAAFLRKALDGDLDVEHLNRPGLLPQEKRMYGELLKLRRRCREDPERRRLRQALDHAGAELEAFDRRDGKYRVSFDLDGDRHTSIIDRRNLTVLSAGICLADEDEKFDLQSLMGVLREARRVQAG